MEYRETIRLKDGRFCYLRNGTADDAEGALANFNLTHEETDYLMTYPVENDLTVEDERKFLQNKTDSSNEIELVAEVDGRIVGTAGIESMGTKQKIRHRAEFGISIERAYWGLGIGSALTAACIECARKAGYEQLELDVVAENKNAIKLYQKEGFVEFGRNPRGFKSLTAGYQELVYMRLELNEAE